MLRSIARRMAKSASETINRNKGKAAVVLALAGSTASTFAVAPDASTLVSTVNTAFELAAAAALIFVGFRLVLRMVSWLLVKK